MATAFVANSKYKIQALFKDPNCIFQAPKLSTKSHILDLDIQNLDCNVTLKCTVDMHTSVCFKIVNRCKISKFARFKFNDFSSIFKHLICFQALSRALKFFYSKFKHFQGFLKHAMNPVANWPAETQSGQVSVDCDQSPSPAAPSRQTEPNSFLHNAFNTVYLA